MGIQEIHEYMYIAYPKAVSIKTNVDINHNYKLVFCSTLLN